MCGGTSADELEEGGRVGDCGSDRGDSGKGERVVDCAAEGEGGGGNESGKGRKTEDAHGCVMGVGSGRWVERDRN